MTVRDVLVQIGFLMVTAGAMLATWAIFTGQFGRGEPPISEDDADSAEPDAVPTEPKRRPPRAKRAGKPARKPATRARKPAAKIARKQATTRKRAPRA